MRTKGFLLFVSVAALAAFMGCSSSNSSSGGSCNDAWNKASAACPMVQTTQQTFLADCNNPSSAFPGCGPQASALAACEKAASSYTCDSNGQPHAAGCQSQEGAVGVCVAAQFADAGLGGD